MTNESIAKQIASKNNVKYDFSSEHPFIQKIAERFMSQDCIFNKKFRWYKDSWKYDENQIIKVAEDEVRKLRNDVAEIIYIQSVRNPL